MLQLGMAVGWGGILRGVSGDDLEVVVRQARLEPVLSAKARHTPSIPHRSTDTVGFRPSPDYFLRSTVTRRVVDKSGYDSRRMIGCCIWSRALCSGRATLSFGGRRCV